MRELKFTTVLWGKTWPVVLQRVPGDCERVSSTTARLRFEDRNKDIWQLMWEFDQELVRKHS